MVWAYKRELVRLSWASEGGGRVGPSAGAVSGTGKLCRTLQLGFVGSGGGAWETGGTPGFKVHPDAEVVHAAVMALPHEARGILMRAAEAGEPPEWSPRIEPFVTGPWLRANGRCRMLVIGGRPAACLLKRTGVPPHEAEAIRARAREHYRVFALALLAVESGLRGANNGEGKILLKRWFIKEIGVSMAPWNKVGIKSVA